MEYCTCRLGYGLKERAKNKTGASSSFRHDEIRNLRHQFRKFEQNFKELEDEKRLHEELLKIIKKSEYQLSLVNNISPSSKEKAFKILDDMQANSLPTNKLAIHQFTKELDNIWQIISQELYLNEGMEKDKKQSGYLFPMLTATMKKVSRIYFVRNCKGS